MYTFLIKLAQGEVYEWIIQFVSIKRWIGIFLFSDLESIDAGHLWYLPSLVIVYLIMIYIERHDLYRLAYRILPFMFLARIVVYIITLSYGLSWHLRGNFLVDSLPWFLLGHYLASHSYLLNKMSNIALITITSIGALIAPVFEIFNFKIDLSEIGITLYAIGLFLISMKQINISRNKILENIGKNYSAGVYVFHLAIAGVLSKFLRIARIDNLVIVMWIKPIMVVLLSILWSMILFHTVSFVKKRKYVLFKQ